MPGRADLDLYNVLLGFGWLRERTELAKATLDPAFLLRAPCPVPAAPRGSAEASPRRRAAAAVIDAADHAPLRGSAFYDLSIDRSRWPELIRTGYERATAALDGLRAPAMARAGRGRA